MHNKLKSCTNGNVITTKDSYSFIRQVVEASTNVSFTTHSGRSLDLVLLEVMILLYLRSIYIFFKVLLTLKF